MRRILLVDDDPLVLRVYGEALARQGWQVETASDGLAAMKALRTTPPDLVVLDLMMPKFSGVDVLKFIRSEPDLAKLPVIVLSNTYVEELAQGVAAVGAQEALLKGHCTPAVLSEIIDDLRQRQAAGEDLSQSLATPKPAVGSQAPQIDTAARAQFIANAASTCAALRQLANTLSGARSSAERDVRLQNFYRRVHLLATAATFAECSPIAQLASVLEALLFGLMDKRSGLSPSVLRTLLGAVDCLEELFQRAPGPQPNTEPIGRVLIIEQDASANRQVVTALHEAQIQVLATADPAAGLAALGQEVYDLILLDFEPPGMDVGALGRRVRMQPGYRATPVILVTGRPEAETRAVLGPDALVEVLAKPVLPLELAVRAVTHLLRK